MPATLPYSLFNLKDKAAGALASAITNAATSLSLTAGQGGRFPDGDFCVRIDDETLYVTTRTTDTFSGLTRGYNGTVAAAHSANATVYQSADASLFKRIYDCLSGHTHPKADIQDFAHTHPQGDITNLVSDLAGKQATSEKGQANGYASLDGTGKVPAAQLPASGSDPWTYLRLASDFTTTSASAVDVTGLSFTPAANQRYEFDAWLMLRTATATVNPRVGLAWATGLTDGVAMIEEAQAANTVPLAANGNINAALLIAVGGLPNTTQSWPARVDGLVIAGASPSGSVRIQLASETNGTTVRVVAGSFLRYRTVP